MHIEPRAVSHHARRMLWIAGLIVLVCSAAALLVSVVALLAGASDVPTHDLPLVSPFRWELVSRVA